MRGENERRDEIFNVNSKSSKMLITETESLVNGRAFLSYRC